MTDELPINYSDGGLIRCPYCIYFKKRSKRFVSIHALKWHLKYKHGGDDKSYDVSEFFNRPSNG